MTEPANANPTPAQNNIQAGTEPAKEPTGLLDGKAAEPAPKANEGNPDASKSEPGKTQEPPKNEVPENYAPFKVEEGFNFDDVSGKKFAELAKENKLTQEKAQAFVDLATEHVKSMVNRQQEEYLKIRKEWVEEIKNDPEFGGSKFDETVVRAQRALKTFVPTNEKGEAKFDMIGLLKNTGLTDNPTMIKFLAHIDKMTGEDKIVKGGPAEEKLSDAEILYGKNKN